MYRARLERELAQAEERVVQGRERIAHQREVVSQLEGQGLDNVIARLILEQLEKSQRIHIADRDRFLAEIGG
jgi:Rod binding domain-containing protein